MTKLSLILSLTLAASSSFAGTLPNQVFNFTGTCSDCTGNGTGVLTVASGYVLGANLQDSDLVSFLYHSNLIDVTIFPSTRPASRLFGIMPVGLGSADIVVEGNFIFKSDVDGNWSIGVADIGTNGIWSQPGAATSTPEPITGVMLVAGLAALTALRRCR